MASEHTLKFVLDPVEGDIWTDIYLCQFRPWYKRVWVAIKYIFNIKPRTGAWDCTLLRQEEYSKLRNLLDKSEKIINSSPKDS